MRTKNDEQEGLEPIITLGYDKENYGTYSARMTVSGLSSEQMAHAAIRHMQRLFCGNGAGRIN